MEDSRCRSSAARSLFLTCNKEECQRRAALSDRPHVCPKVRDMIVTRPDIGFLRTDDDFILRFLRARKFDQVETFRLLAQYFQFRQQNLDMFQSFKV